MLSLLRFSLYLSLFLTETLSESCNNDYGIECSPQNHNFYTAESNERFSKYLELIENSANSYLPCNQTNCNCYLDVIKNDLKPFKQAGITKQMLDNVKAKGTKYQIINNRLYRDKNCMFPARCNGIEHFLLKLLPKLPDLELIVNTRDWPQLPKHYNLIGPVFSFSKTLDYYDIMYPAWAFWEGGPAITLYPRGIGRWDQHRKILGQLGNTTGWRVKTTKGFFRGSRTSSERDPLILLSRKKPDLVDAQYTKNQAWKSDADTLHQPPAAEVSFEEHCQYKYLFNFRGVAASFRFKHILLCKSLVFHVGNEWLEFFYPLLKPWVHYVPVDSNAKEDVYEELLEFARDHDDVSRKIAENGHNLIWNRLKLADIECYWRKLLKQYAKLLRFQPELDPNLIEIQ